MRGRRLAAGAALWWMVVAAGGCSAPSREERAAAFHRNNLGVALLDHGHREDASQEFRAALEAWPGHVEARVNLGIALHYGGDHEAAARELKKALAAQPDHPRAHYVLGLIDYYHGARYADAASHFQRVSVHDPSDPWTLFYLGLSLLRIDRPDAAADSLRRASELNPGHQAALYQLSLALKASGRAADASVALDRFKELRARLPAANVPGVGYGEQGPYAEAAGQTEPGRSLAFAPLQPSAAALETLELRVRMGLAGDLDNDGHEETVTLESGTISVWPGRGEGDRVAAAALSDVDHDGDLDVYLVRDGEAASLLRNDGTGRFTDIAREAGVSGEGWRGSGVAFGDFDNDRAVDFCVSRLDGPPVIFWNRRDGSFDRMILQSGPAVAVSTGDVDQNGLLDLLLTGAPAQPPRILLGRRGRGFAEAGAVAPAGFPGGEEPRCLLHDADLDGDLDIVCADLAAGELRPRILANLVRESGAGRRLDVEVQGLIHPQVLSNHSGIGSTVEVRAPGLWLRRDRQAATGLAAGSPSSLTFGLGDTGELDYVRALFPSGVRLTKRGIRADQRLVMEEPAGKYTSCPMIYTWDGGRFVFVNDTLGFAALGEWQGPGSWVLPDPDEWLLIDGDALSPRPDRAGARDSLAAEIRFVNQLQEISLSDTMRLMAVDHPGSMSVFPAEPDPSPGQESRPPRLFHVGRLRPAAGIRDEHGHDALPALARIDRVHHDDFDLLGYRGLAARHELVIDPGRLANAGSVLVLHGWTEWGGSSSLRAASQAGIGIEPVSLEVSLAGGPWLPISPDIGLPAGLPRSIVVALPPHLNGRQDARLRLRTNLVIYWDAVLVGDETGEVPPRLTELPLESARLRRLGYPQADPARRRSRPSDPEAFDYARLSPVAEWGRIAGAYTRYGDVVPLLLRRDDRFVVLNHGDEIAVSFDASALPAVPAGWRRDYLLYVNGYGKDMDINSAHPSTVSPYPYAAMRAYPWQPDEGPDPALVEHLFEWNTRSP